jgi:hypothetical protein
MSSSPKWFRPVAVIALLWNLAGCAAYLADVTLSPAQIGTMSPAQQALYAARPLWSVAATAIAVWLGAAGCLGLILRKNWATWLLLASLVGVIGQDLWLFVLSGSASEAGAVAFALQGLVLAVSVALVVLARRGSAQGWLS